MVFRPIPWRLVSAPRRPGWSVSDHERGDPGGVGTPDAALPLEATMDHPALPSSSARPPRAFLTLAVLAVGLHLACKEKDNTPVDAALEKTGTGGDGGQGGSGGSGGSGGGGDGGDGGQGGS